ncbi:MAG: PKD domain-containing protein [Saprospiraceae bacterium]|nr:PKD domain-containing protein [Saprospiraceae bacterium]
MKSGILTFFILLACFFGLNAQTITGNQVQSSSKPTLDKIFKHYEVVTLNIKEIQSTLNTRSTVKKLQLDLGSKSWPLDLFEYDLYGKDFYLSVSGDNGVTRRPRNKDIKTFKSILRTPRGGWGCLTLTNDFFTGHVVDAGQSIYFEMVSSLDPAAPKDEIVIYSESDVIRNSGITCGFEEYEKAMQLNQKESHNNDINSRGVCRSVDIALSCDKTLHDAKGGVAQADAFMTSVLNNVQTNYDNEFNDAVEFTISTVFVASTVGGDPWNGSTTINAQLDQHRAWGNSGGYGGASYAVATNWTRKFTSGAIGLAWLSAVCSSFRYNVCSDYGGSVGGGLRVLQAHELGHNFSCQHDAAGSNTIMAPAVNGSNTWSSNSISSVNNYLPGLGCLGTCSAGDPPVANFKGNPTFVCATGKVQFTDLSTGSPSSWLWTFPGGSPSTSTQQNPLVTYTTKGVYDVTLKVTNQFGSNEETFSLYIDVEAKAVPIFTTSVIDRDLTTTNNSLNGDSYLWSFGDGNKSTEEEPYHTYAEDGVYTVELAVTNRCGTVKKNVKVNVVTPNEANFSSDVQDGCSVLKVKYKNLSSKNSNTFEWEFPGGNPSKSTLKEPIVTYTEKGQFDVKLTAFNSRYRHTKYEVKYIKVDSTPIANFEAAAPLGNLIKFINKSIDATTYAWDFGDNSKSSEVEPEHNFPGPGKYNVCLISTGKCGKDTTCQEVEISTTLNSKFSIDNAKGCVPFEVQFKNNSTGATSYEWSFPGGNPSSSTDPNPKVTYDKVGVYDVTLVAINGTDKSTLSQTAFINVGAAPVAEYQSTVSGYAVSFNNTSKNGGSYLWDFGDKETSTEENPTHTYKAEGEYEVTMTMTNDCGTSELKQRVIVYLIPKVNFSSSKTRICAGDHVTFLDESSKDVNDWAWQFEGGEPATSTEKNPLIYYAKPGFYAAKLTVKNTNGENFITKSNYIEVISSVLCPDKTGKKRKVQLGEESDPGKSLNNRNRTNAELTVLPNPNSGVFNILLGQVSPKSGISVVLSDIMGRKLYVNNSPEVHGGVINLNLNYLESGTYLLQCKMDDILLSKKLIINK